MRSYHKTGGLAGQPAYRTSTMFQNKIKFRVRVDKIKNREKATFSNRLKNVSNKMGQLLILD